jgi:hypothetical protein
LSERLSLCASKTSAKAATAGRPIALEVFTFFEPGIAVAFVELMQMHGQFWPSLCSAGQLVARVCVTATSTSFGLQSLQSPLISAQKQNGEH